MYEITQLPEPLIFAEHPGIVQVGTIRFPQNAKCKRCSKTGVEMVIIEKGKFVPYHWKCIKKRRRFVNKSQFPGQLEASTGVSTSPDDVSGVSED